MREWISYIGFIPKGIRLKWYSDMVPGSSVDNITTRVLLMFWWRTHDAQESKPATKDWFFLDLPGISEGGNDKNNLKDYFEE